MCITPSTSGTKNKIDGIIGPSDIVSLTELRAHIDQLKTDLDWLYKATEKNLKKLKG